MNDRVNETGLSYGMVQDALASSFEHCRAITEGDVARYIPELASADPSPFGLAVAAANGALWTFGDAEMEFTIQSVSKAFSYCLALELVGRDAVFEHVGVEPSGDAFNAIILDPTTNRPFNPMVNAGAITIASLLYRKLGDKALDYLLEQMSRAAGRQLSISEPVYRSEALTGHRNRAIAHLLVNVGAADYPVEPALDLYFRQCSILVTAVDLARMGSTFANLGHNPITGDAVFDVSSVRDTLSVMITCGMYDYTGHWVVDVGVPAKSGVGGGICGVVNRQVGIGTFSPRLDRTGNSVRGLAIFRRLADELGLHAFDCTNRGSDFLRGFL